MNRSPTDGTVDLGRYHCRYTVAGAGPCLVLIHGLADTCRSFGPLVDRLADRFRCLVYELPTGVGDGAHLSRFTWSDLAGDLFGLLDHLRVESAYVLGVSFGAWLALAAAGTRPERLPRLVVHRAVSRRLTRAERLLARLAGHWALPLASVPLRERLLRYQAGDSFGGRPSEEWAALVTNSGSVPVQAVARRALLLDELEVGSLLPAVRQPVLVLTGEGEPAADRAAQAALAHALPQAVHVELTGAGPFALASHADATAAAVRQFLQPPVCAPDRPACTSV